MLKWPLLLSLALFGMGVSAAPPPVTVTSIPWHGWPHAVKLSNGVVEAMVVPQIGRVMAFQMAGHPETNPLYENPDWMPAKNHLPKPGEWANYGGDKVWPAPQSDWPRYLGRDWPPDRAFDGLPETVHLLPGGLRLTSPLSSEFGLRVERTLTLRPGQPCLYLTQTLARTSPGAAPDRSLAAWAITQINGDGLVVLPLPAPAAAPTPFPTGYQSLSPPPVAPPFWRVTAVQGRRMLLVRRDPVNSHKAATKARDGWLVHVSAAGIVFAEHSAVAPGGVYPDDNSPGEVYSNAGDSNYLEMETLGPLAPLRPGQSLTTQIVWRLSRLPAAPASDAEAALAAVRAAAAP